MEAAPQPSEEALEHLFDTVVGTITLRAGDIGRQREFYENAIGLRSRDGSDPTKVEMDDAQGRILIRLDSSRSAGSAPLRTPHAGLFHTAFRFPHRAALGAAATRAAAARATFQGASDHGVSEAFYFADPEGNGIELYRDRPYEEWPAAERNRVEMFTAPLDTRALLAEAAPRPEIATCDVGHIHLMTAAVEPAMAFWRDVIGLDERQRFGPSAIFLAEGIYHHHLGANVWQSAGASPAPPDRPGLEGFELRLRSHDAVEAAAERLERAGTPVERTEAGLSFADVDGNRVELSVR